MPFWFKKHIFVVVGLTCYSCCMCPPPTSPTSSTPHMSGTQKSLIFHLGFEMHVMLLPDLGCVWFMWWFAFQATLSVKKAVVVAFVHVVVFSFFPGENIDIFGIWVFNSSFYLFIWLCIWHRLDTCFTLIFLAWAGMWVLFVLSVIIYCKSSSSSSISSW